MGRITIIAAAAILLAMPAIAQNLLVNPGFSLADQLTGWTCTTTNGLASWSALDRLNTPDSGSMQHDTASPSNNAYMWCAQCVLVGEGQEHIASGWYYWPDDPDVSQQGSTRASFWFLENLDCTGTSVPGPTETSNPVLDTWTHFQTDAVAVPTGFQSAIVYFGTWQNLADEPVRVRLDDLDFRVNPDFIFADGFESGGTGAWSTTSP